MFGLRPEEEAALLFLLVLLSLLIYLVCLHFWSRRKARKTGVSKDSPRHGRIVGWMLLGWFLGMLFAPGMLLPSVGNALTREYERAFCIIHWAIFGAVIGVALDLLQYRIDEQLLQLGSLRPSPWRFSLWSLLLFIAVVGMMCVCVRLYIDMFIH